MIHYSMMNVLSDNDDNFSDSAVAQSIQYSCKVPAINYDAGINKDRSLGAL